MAYCHIPIHLLWQVKQVLTFEGMRHVDHNLTCGTRSIPKIWCTFFGLIIWIAIHVYCCKDLLHYMDDAWSYDMNLVLTYYTPYGTFYPAKQVALLQ